MARKRKSYPLRIDPEVHAALERWAADELRSVNAQIEFLLRQAVTQAGRLKSPGASAAGADRSGRSGAPDNDLR
ncbi:MAG: hypothetical protein AAGA37_15985 [Actinomycetota bacterium]